ncbi:hypothetical protein [Streptosporangium canum]|uniref:hypothetical protein n=1 Tax=Streptosporangium canum TaxID=324952 RepID=UPI0037B8BCF6
MITVPAHPRASSRGHIVPDTLIAELAAAGLRGVETDHMDHTDHSATDRARAPARPRPGPAGHRLQRLPRHRDVGLVRRMVDSQLERRRK